MEIIDQANFIARSFDERFSNWWGNQDIPNKILVIVFILTLIYLGVKSLIG